MTPQTLGNLQECMSNNPSRRNPLTIAEEIRLTAEQLIFQSRVEEDRDKDSKAKEARHLASAELLVDLLKFIAEYSVARGWNCDRLMHRAILRSTVSE